MTTDRLHVPSGGVPCSGCGYDLRGLPKEGKCPECGTPVEQSLAGNRLVDADPTWLARIARGAKFLASAMLLLCCGTAGIFALMLIRL